MNNLAKRPLHRQAHELLATARDFSAIATASPDLQLRIINLLVRAALGEPVRQVQIDGMLALLKIKEARAA
jgi:hypothetical protein